MRESSLPDLQRSVIVIYGWISPLLKESENTPKKNSVFLASLCWTLSKAIYHQNRLKRIYTWRIFRKQRFSYDSNRRVCVHFTIHFEDKFFFVNKVAFKQVYFIFINRKTKPHLYKFLVKKENKSHWQVTWKIYFVTYFTTEAFTFNCCFTVL